MTLDSTPNPDTAPYLIMAASDTQDSEHLMIERPERASGWSAAVDQARRSFLTLAYLEEDETEAENGDEETDAEEEPTGGLLTPEAVFLRAVPARPGPFTVTWSTERGVCTVSVHAGDV